VLYDELDFHLVSDEPAQLFMGELPRRWEEVPTRVVVNLCGVYPVGEPYGRIVHGMALLDVLDPQLVPARETFESFLDAVHIYAGSEATYWHCHAGINRSGLAVAAYLHRYRGLRISDAIDHLRRTRTPMVLCNNVFERTLRDWYGDDDEQDFDVVPIDTYLARRGGRGGL
jgi:hypothetical protein